MAKIKVDFTNTEDSKGDVGAGKYNVRVEGIEQKAGKEYPYLEWKLKIIGGSCAGLHIYHKTSLSPKALFNLRDTLLACGVKVPKAAISFDPAQLVGCEMEVTVVMEKADNGNEYPKVKKTSAIVATPFDTDDEDDEDTVF